MTLGDYQPSKFPTPVCTNSQPHPRHRITGTWGEHCAGIFPAATPAPAEPAYTIKSYRTRRSAQAPDVPLQRYMVCSRTCRTTVMLVRQLEAWGVPARLHGETAGRYEQQGLVVEWGLA